MNARSSRVWIGLALTSVGAFVAATAAIEFRSLRAPSVDSEREAIGSTRLGAPLDPAREAGASASEPDGRLAGSDERGGRAQLASTWTLRLRRDPDGVPLDHVCLEVDPPPIAWALDEVHATDVEGRIELRGVLGEHFTLRADGFDACDVDLTRSRSGQLDLALTPSSGLIGRVVHADGTPAASASVFVQRFELRIVGAFDARSNSDDVWIREEPRRVDRAVTAADGRFYLSIPSTNGRETLRLVARAAAGSEAVLDVALPRASSRLPDLVLCSVARLEVRVFDERGAPIPGARVWSPENGGDPELDALTDARGIAALPVLGFPASVAAATADAAPLAVLVDGHSLAASGKLENADGRVEILMRKLETVGIRVIDDESLEDVRDFEARVEFLSGGEVVSERDVELDAGVARFSFAAPSTPAAADFDAARVSILARGYLPSAPFSIAPTMQPGARSFELHLVPDPRRVTARGRVARSSTRATLQRVRVTCFSEMPRAGVRPTSSFDVPCDATGRFSAHIIALDSDPWITLSVAPLRDGEFGVFGPVPLAIAAADEPELELDSGIEVPMRLRGLAASGDYRVELHRIDSSGLDVALDKPTRWSAAEGDEARGVLHVPAHGTTRVVVLAEERSSGSAVEVASVVVDGRCAPAELRLELPPVFSTLAGRVVGVDATDCTRVVVIVQREGNPRAQEPGRVAADGSFRFEGLLSGSYDVLLVARGGVGEPSRVIARMQLALENPIEQVELAPTRDDWRSR